MKNTILAAITLLIFAVGNVSTAQAEITVPPVGTKMTVAKSGGAVLYTPPLAAKPSGKSALESYIQAMDKKMDKSLKNQGYIGAKVRESIRKIDTLKVDVKATKEAVEDLGITVGQYADGMKQALEKNTVALNAAETAIKSLKSDNDSLTDTAENFELLFYAIGGAIATLLFVALYFAFKGGGKRKKKAQPAEQQPGERTLS